MVNRAGRGGERRTHPVAWRSMLVASLATAAVLLLSAASASAAWTHYFNLVKGKGVGVTRVAVAPDGTAVFSWEQSGGLRTRARNPDGTLSPIQTVAPPQTMGGGFQPAELAVDSDGNAFYVWPVGIDDHALRARVRYADGTLGPVQTLATSRGDNAGGGLQDFRVGVDGTGRAVFSWIRYTRDGAVLQARGRSATGALGQVVTVSSRAFFDQLAVASSGRAIFAWESHGGVRGRAMSPAGDLGPVQQVSTSTQASDPHVVAAGTRVLFSWRQGGDNAQIMARELSGGSLTPPDVIASGGLLSSIWPTVAMAPDGRAAFCWYQSNPLGRVRSPSGALGPIETITPDGDCVLDMDATGNLIFSGDTVSSDGKRRIFVRAQPAGGALGPMRLLSQPGYNASFPLIDVNAAGDAAVVWSEGQSGFAVQAAVGP